MPHWFYSDGRSAVTITFEDSQQATATAASHTFTSMDFGDESADRYIIACLSWQGSTSWRTVSSVTIGGVTATQLASTVDAGNFSFRSTAMFIALVPTGATGDVVLTLNNNAVNWACTVNSVTGIDSVTPDDTGTSTAANPTANMDCGANGAIIGCAVTGQASPPSATWSGITEDSDVNYGASNQQCFTSAHGNFATAQSGLACTCTFSVSNGSAGVFAAFNF